MDSRDIERTGKALMDDLQRSLSEHPEPELLLAYEEGELSEDRAASVRSHLAICRTCADFVLDLAACPEASEADPGGEAAPLAGTRRPEATHGESRHAGGGQEVRSSGARTLSARLPLLKVAASLLLVTTLLLSFQVWQLQSRIAAFSTPVANVPIAELFAEGEGIKRSGTGVAESGLPASAPSYVLVFNVIGREPAPRYRLSITRTDGDPNRVRIEREDLEPLPGTMPNLQLRRGDLPPGAYRADLFAERPDGSEAVGTYLFTIRPD